MRREASIYVFLILVLATGCQTDQSLQARDSRSLAWSGRVNVDPRSTRGTDALADAPRMVSAWRPGIEVEVSYLDDSARHTSGPGRILDYTSVQATAAWAPEVKLWDRLSLGGRLGGGWLQHDFEHARGSAGTTTATAAGFGLFGGAEIAVDVCPRLQVYGRYASLDLHDHRSEYAEAGVKLGLSPSVWVFCAYRDSTLAQDSITLGPPLRELEVRTEGLVVGGELRF